MRKSMLIALVALSAGLAVPPSALAETSPAVVSELRPNSANTESAESRLNWAQEAHKEAVRLAEIVSKHLAAKRRDKDILTVNALNRKLTEINATADTLEQRIRDLETAYAGNDSGRANHEFTVISVLRERIGQFDREVVKILADSYYGPRASQVVTTTNSDTINGIQIAPLPNPPGGGGGGGGTGLVFPQPGQGGSPN